MPKDTEIAQKNNRTDIPAPVKAALKVLAGLEKDRAEKLRRALPAYAMTLARQGRAVTEQVLHDALAKGDDTVMGPRPAFTKAAETIEQRYERIVGRWPKPENPRDKDDVSLSPEERLICAARRGDIAMVHNFIKQGIDIHTRGDLALCSAATAGHLTVVEYLADHGADIRARGNLALSNAAHNGHFTIVKYLVEHGANIRAQNDHALCAAAENGHLEIVKYLADHGANIRAQNAHALCLASQKGHLEVVEYLIGQGANIRAQNAYTLRWATTSKHYDVVRYLVDHGSDMAILDPDEKEKIKSVLRNMTAWMEKTGTYPPTGLEDKVPGSFDPIAVNAIGVLISKEGYDKRWANRYAHRTIRLFDTAEKVMDYFEKWAKPGKQPMHNVVQIISVPDNVSDLQSWASAVIEHGPEMAKLVKFSDKLLQPVRSADGKGWSFTKTRAETAKFAYVRGLESPELAALFNKHSKTEYSFNTALDIVKKYKGKKHSRIPEITIDGETFGLPKTVFKKLPDGDYRGLVLGELTACCQSIGGVGAECAEHGFTSENSGFYIVAVNDNKKGEEIIGQSWAWRGTKGELVLDSLETLGDRIKPEQWTKLAKEFAKALKKTDVTALHIGKGGGTPSNMPFEAAQIPAQPADYDGYRDSDQQYKITLKKTR